MTTAFQSNAFQNDAFQIDVSIDKHDGGGTHIDHGYRRKKQPPGNIQLVYDQARDLPKEQSIKLLSAIDPYIDTETIEEQKRRDNAEYVMDKLPEFGRINYAALEANSLAYARFSTALKDIENQLINFNKALEDDEELMLFTFLSCTIN